MNANVEYVSRNMKCRNIKISLIFVLEKLVFVTYEN